MNVKRMLAMFLVFVLVLSMFPGAALASAELGESDAGDDNASQEADSVPEQQSNVDEEPVQAPANPEAEDLPAQAESAPEAVVPSPEKAKTDLEADASGEEAPAEAEEETTGPHTELIAQISQGNSRFQLMAPSGTVFSEDAALSARIVEPDDEQMSDICLRYELPGILDYFVFEMSTTGVTHPNETAAVVIDFESPFLKAISPSAVAVFQYIEGAPVPIPVTATVSDTKETTKMVIEPETRSFNSRYVVMTTDAPADMLEVGTQVAYMAVNTINNKRVGLFGNGISFTTSGIMWHYISDQRKPAICLQPNKTFQTSNAAVYYTEATTLSGSSTGSVGGNVWNKLSWNQRRLIGLIALYGVQTNWDNSVGNAGLNTGYNLQNPTNPNQCLFAAQQIMTWEVVTGNRSATYPYSCTNSKLINAFGGDVPAQYAWLENQIRAHDNATTTIPSPERSTYRLAWLSASFQTVIQVLEVEYETPVPPTADLFVQKTSSTATGAYANQQFTFKVFKNAALTSQVGSTQYLSPGRSFSITLDPDRTYYVAEVAENGWNCTTPGVSTKTVNGVTYYYCSITPSAGGTYSVSFNNEPVIRRNISLQKGINTPTSCTGLIRNNAMYSLAGAEYSVSLNGVYQETLVTDANGYATSSRTYAVGEQLTIKETKAPKGFKLDSSSHSLTVVDGTNTLRVSDIPLFDVPFVITKVDANTNGPQGSTSFSDAVFRWEYYDNTSWSGTPKATWYFTTDTNGKMQYHPNYVANGYTSSALYSPSTSSYQLPLGSLKITEIKAPVGYAPIHDPLLCTITQDGSGSANATANWTADSLKLLKSVGADSYTLAEPIDPLLFGSVTVQKADSLTGGVPQGATTLAGAEFQIINSNATNVVVENQIIAPGAVCKTISTNAEGSAASGTGVLPLGKYTIRESKAPSGYSLNAQWSKEFTVSTQQKDFSFTSDTACADEVIRGGLKIIKQDSNKLEKTDQGCDLSGITFSVISENLNPVVVDGKTYRKGETVMTLEIRWNGSAWTSSTAHNALPYGSYTVKENPKEPGSDMANDGYLLNPTSQTIEIRNPSTIVSTTFLDEPRSAGKIRIEKMTSSNTHLEGVSFLLQWSTDGQHWQRVTYSEQEGTEGGCTTQGLQNGILKTNSDGIVEFTGLHPKLQYRITEAATVNGYSLLADAAYEGPLPSDNLELYLRVVDTTTFVLPHTGSTAMRLLPAFSALCMLCGIALLAYRRKRM